MHIPAHVRIYSVFFLFALALGGMLSRMADLQHQLGVSESELGLTLIGMAIGSLISLTIASPLIHRLGGAGHRLWHGSALCTGALVAECRGGVRRAVHRRVSRRSA
jgi:hypothetical protein